MNHRVRPYRREDAGALARIFAAAVAAVAPRYYGAAEVAAWLAEAPSPADIEEKNGDGRLVFVAIDRMDKAIGWIDLEPDGHIDMLFCAPEWTGKGVASALFSSLEDAARRLGIARLHVEASAAAKPIFEKWGFTVVRRQNVRLPSGTIHNYAMARELALSGKAEVSP